MGQVLKFPKKTNADPNSVVFMQAYVRSYVVDLTKHRQELLALKRELAKIRRRLEIRLIKNEPGSDQA